MKIKLSQNQLTLIISIFFVLFYNLAFFSKTFAVYPIDTQNIFFLASIVIILISATNLMLSLLLLIMNSFLRVVRLKVVYKRFFLVVFFLAMLAAYVMDTYSTVIDDTMLLNILKTDAKESLDLVTIKLFFYIIFLFVLPMFLIFKIEVKEVLFKKDLVLKLKTILISLVVIFVMTISFGKFYASFLREQKPLRYYTNPTYWIYSMGKFGSSFFKNPSKALEAIGKGSIIPVHDVDRDMVILVVGETARRDSFSLNGNKNETNPLLKKENVLSFTNATSCGTSTAISVPCMFSYFGRSKFNVDDANSTENLLDVLSHTQEVNILWRDNNSDSKGVAVRAKFEDYKTSATNTICDEECRDVGMLVGLQKHIDSVKEKDILIVLHQMGNHGPAYYKRYPKEFEVFRPVCKTSELGKCTNEEITNAYDNAILYTDYFLSKVITLLKANSSKFNTAMLYVSDHGESLGENGIYLHGLPYMMAPKEQKDIAMIMWFGGGMEAETNYVLLKKRLNEPYSHDNVFHTILGMFEVESSVYKPEMDILDGVHIQINSTKNN
ncbi:phosphoethanolamine--lipid A transferase [Bacteriovorax sp. PP10]|uniref:Phosphoethanolamine--lipid A transferase n=1 Tax=Bacteriovorax antarcticus TaxID=3088717 RepID=A0ABU5VRZ7_9BACT|nr:phosphoethanolamine--lipid A transferase [Bacteriovorax sp. PP10]MEA9355824.1 phosphoethanolamine--lipid A transferase [Bacteriovorax sp. PP10]